MPAKGQFKEDVSKGTWYKRAAYMYSLDNQICELCGRSAESRHHKDGDYTNLDRDNIQFLCLNCHYADVHRERLHLRKTGRTHCANGHEWIPENLMINNKKKGYMTCKICHKERERERRR